VADLGFSKGGFLQKFSSEFVEDQTEKKGHDQLLSTFLNTASSI